MAAYLIAMEGLSLLLQAVSSLPLLFIETGWSRLHFFFPSCLEDLLSNKHFSMIIYHHPHHCLFGENPLCIIHLQMLFI